MLICDSVGGPGLERLAMTGLKRDKAERKRREFGRDGVGGLSPVIAARRRLRATRPGVVRNSPSGAGGGVATGFV